MSTRNPSSADLSPLLATLESTWLAIRTAHPDVPPVVITLGQGTDPRQKGVLLGQFARLRWKSVGSEDQHHEVMITGEALAGGREPTGSHQVLNTLLHEAAHALAVVRQIRDTSRQGRYHNRRFQELATEMGLHVEKEGSSGWSGTYLTEETTQRFKEELERMEAEIQVYRLRFDAGGTAAASEKKPSRVTLICDCQRRILVAPGTADQGGIRCDLCKGLFSLQP